MHDKVFAYIAQSQQNETLECHAYLCTKRKVVSLSVCLWPLFQIVSLPGGGFVNECATPSLSFPLLI